MDEQKQKKWYNSSSRWVYLKVAFLCLSTPSKVYELAHKSHSTTPHEKMIRGRLLQAGILNTKTTGSSEKIDLENGHI